MSYHSPFLAINSRLISSRIQASLEKMPGPLARCVCSNRVIVTTVLSRLRFNSCRPIALATPKKSAYLWASPVQVREVRTFNLTGVRDDRLFPLLALRSRSDFSGNGIPTRLYIDLFRLTGTHQGKSGPRSVALRTSSGIKMNTTKVMVASKDVADTARPRKKNLAKLPICGLDSRANIHSTLLSVTSRQIIDLQERESRQETVNSRLRFPPLPCSYRPVAGTVLMGRHLALASDGLGLIGGKPRRLEVLEVRSGRWLAPAACRSLRSGARAAAEADR